MVTSEQIQELLRVAGTPSYTPPASVVTPRPTPVMNPKPAPVMPVVGAFGNTPITPITPSASPVPVVPVNEKKPQTMTGGFGGTGFAASKSARERQEAIENSPLYSEVQSANSALNEYVKEKHGNSENSAQSDPVYQKMVDDLFALQDRAAGVSSSSQSITPQTPTPVTPPPESTAAAPEPVTPISTPSTADPVIAADALKNMRAMTKNMTPEQLREVSTYAPGVAEQLRGPTTPKSAIQSYKDTLLGAAGRNVYDIIDDVDEVDDFYDMAFRGSVLEPLETDKKAITARDTTDGKARGDQYLSGKRGDVFAFTPDEYISEVGAPEYLKGLKSGVGADKDVIRSAYGSIANTGGADTAAALSNYYGFDVTPIGSAPDIKNFGGNYEEHTNASQEQISEFQSLIKPVLAETIPYLQATEGLDYQDALLEAYKRDPMVQSMYAKYGVQPVRQTKDGSTYLYDPMTFGEIRTKEVKDSSVKDALKVAAIVGLSVFGGGALAGTAAFGGGTSAAGSALAYGTTSAGITAATGGDTNDILKSFALGGVGGFAKGLNANAAGLADKARQGAFTLGAAAPDPALIEAANAAAKTADTFGKVVQGAKFVDAAIDGNLAGAAVATFGPKFTKTAMNKVGLNEKFLDGYNINQDDAVAGLVKTQLELTKGTDFGDAIARGFGEYIMEGGALAPSNVKTPEFIKMIGDAIKASGSMFDDAILQPVRGFVEGTVEVLGDVAEPVVDVIEDVAGAVVDKAPLIEDAVRATGSAIEDVIKPIVDPIIDAAPAVEDAVRAVGSTIDDVIIEPIKDLVEAIDLPDIDLPDIDLPDIDLPDIDLPDIDLPDVDLPDVDLLDVDLPDVDLPIFAQTPPIRRSAPRIIRERTADIAQIDGYERGTDDIATYLAGLSGMANGGAVRSSYGNLDELLRIVGGK